MRGLAGPGECLVAVCYPSLALRVAATRYSPFADDDGDQMAIFKNIVKAKLRFPSHVMRNKPAKDLIGKLLER